MRPGKRETTGSGDLFRARLDQIIDMRHELVRLAEKIDWAWLDGELAGCFSDQGRPAVPTRFMIGLLLLKHIHKLSDEAVCARWVENPYFQYFTGEEFFQHAFPHERSGLSHWRNRIGDKLELLLAESLRVAHDTGALKPRDLARVTVDTTVQPKNVTHPTDAKLIVKAIEQLGALAKEHGVPLRQSYVRVGKRAALMAGRYAPTLHLGQAVQARGTGAPLPAYPPGPPDPRHRPQDRWRPGAGTGLRPSPRQGPADPPPAPEPTRLEALLLARAGGRVHRPLRQAQEARRTSPTSSG